MSKQPEALRIANRMDLIGIALVPLTDSASAVIRRQHALIEEMREALQNMIEAAGALQNTCGAIYGATPEDSDTFTHDRWAEDFLRETTSASLSVLAKAESQQ